MDRDVEKPAEEPTWERAHLPRALEDAQANAWAQLASRFGPKKTTAATAAEAAPTTFQAPPERTSWSAPTESPVLPSASVAALWGWSSGEPSRK